MKTEKFGELAIETLVDLGYATGREWTDEFIKNNPEIYENKIAQLGAKKAYAQIQSQIQAIASKNEEFNGMMRVLNTKPITYAIVK